MKVDDGTRRYWLLTILFLLTVSGCSLPVTKGGSVADRECRYNPLLFPPVAAPAVEKPSPFIGITMGSAPVEGGGISVEYVVEESSAERAGIRRGDTIVAVDGLPFDKSDEEPQSRLKSVVLERGVGGEIGLALLREGERLTVEARIGERPTAPATATGYGEIDDMQGQLDPLSSPLYREVERRGVTDGFRETLIHLYGKSRLADSYTVSPDNPFRLGEINYALQNPGNIIPQARGISRGLLAPVTDKGVEVDRLIKEASRRLDADFDIPEFETPPLRSKDDLVEFIVEVAARAKRYRAAALNKLTGDELDFLKAKSLEILSDDGDDDSKEEADDEEVLKLLKIARKIDYPKLFAAAAEAARLVSPEVIASLERLDVGSFKRNPSLQDDTGYGDIIDVVDTRFGTIVIGGAGTTHYRGEAFVIIDFGGDDLYEGGGAVTGKGPMNVVIDLAGNDSYIRRTSLAQGAALLGTGIVMDMSGNDIYLAEGFSQGCGIFGVGLLIDMEGDDRYSAASYGEGAGFFGIGIVVDKGGDDTYEAERLSQGYASVKGLGAIVDIEGDDYYSAGGRYPDHREPDVATQSLSQGFATGLRPYTSQVGAPGGIGVLVDGSGDDTYVGDYFAQGSSYWYSLGILHDMSGNDRYMAGRYAQGAGIHVSAGLLIDEGGDDTYLVTFGVAQGVGHDFGVGVLADFSGDDFYRGGLLSQGAATCGSVGVLYDSNGEDAYLPHKKMDRGKRDDSCGAAGYGLRVMGGDGGCKKYE
ncbi:MAG: PDZ domain-containing protein [Thermodesulfobacteriota bacterium]